ncbi:xanthine dehydrogenase accessory factor [Desulforhopalus singaporensis]|uniref:Xanthine dehydrogenase accessory factor n=2 Tax=Desulforhopalus singaporensis TaxID=91360 RepID=A0A1H0UTE3_9BACT|nr:xanthine dehydrogenase accessory factor [Desulforhopalus singaporensis]
MASGIAWRLFRSGFKNIILLDIENPMAVRRTVCFCEAIYDGRKTVDGVHAVLAQRDIEIDKTLNDNCIPVVIDPDWETILKRKPKVIIDAILAKKNLGTRIDDAELVIGLGPGFYAGSDVDMVIETHRGPNFGRVIFNGEASRDTGIPANVMGYDVERVIRAPASGRIQCAVQINDAVKAGDVIGTVQKKAVKALINGTVRGLIRNNIFVEKNVKIGDIEPRENVNNMLVSDKSLGLGGAVLEAVLSRFNI